ncbi:GNAT family N-acetyltransferase [Nocardia panacis]|nr:GNAT family N-acetyltransferase [Nocardia panacis]
MFSKVITDFWREQMFASAAIGANGDFAVTVNPDLKQDSGVMILEIADGATIATLAPALAAKIGLQSADAPTAAGFRKLLTDAEIALNGADFLFYFTEAAKSELLAENNDSRVRRLTAEDAELFAAFESATPEQDLDDAYVELDHEIVYGSFDSGALVCAASSYTWAAGDYTREKDSAISDFGVVTVPEHRGKGHARAAVRALARHAYAAGLEPQYRCQLDNAASVALAGKSGLTLFGNWDRIAD